MYHATMNVQKMTHWEGGKTAVADGLIWHEPTAQVFNEPEGILMRPAVAVTTALLRNSRIPLKSFVIDR